MQRIHDLACVAVAQKSHASMTPSSCISWLLVLSDLRRVDRPSWVGPWFTTTDKAAMLTLELSPKSTALTDRQALRQRTRHIGKAAGR